MGTGDWKDGMNRVGAGGNGESVWNGWFHLALPPQVPGAPLPAARPLPWKQVNARLSACLKASAAGPVVVTRNGKAVAVLLGVEDDDELPL
jgi:prevent-host-death family protein